MWRATVLTIFPELFPGPLGASLAGKASASGLWSLETVDIRDFAADRHRSVDDTPAGGGPGMTGPTSERPHEAPPGGGHIPRGLTDPARISSGRLFTEAANDIRSDGVYDLAFAPGGASR